MDIIIIIFVLATVLQMGTRSKLHIVLERLLERQFVKKLYREVYVISDCRNYFFL